MVDTNPRGLGEFLQIGHEILYAAVPVCQQQHEQYQLDDPQYPTSQVKQLCRKDLYINNYSNTQLDWHKQWNLSHDRLKMRYPYFRDNFLYTCIDPYFRGLQTQ